MSRSDYVSKFVTCAQCGEPVDEEEAMWQDTPKGGFYTPFHGTCEEWKYWRDKWRAANPFRTMEASSEPQEEAPKKRTRGMQNVQTVENKRSAGKGKVASQRVGMNTVRRRRTKAEIEAGVPPFNAVKIPVAKTSSPRRRRTKAEIEAGVRPFKNNNVPLRPDIANKSRGRCKNDI